MSSQVHKANIVALLVGVLLATGCYAHGGKPAGGEEADLARWAEEACARGDMRAYDAFIARLRARGEKGESSVEEPACPSL